MTVHLTEISKNGYNCTTMKKTTVILMLSLLLAGMPAQSDASLLIERIFHRVDVAFQNFKKNVKESVSEVKEEASDVKEYISEKASNAKTKVAEKASSIKEKASSAVSNIKQKVSDGVSNVKEATVKENNEATIMLSASKSDATNTSVAGAPVAYSASENKVTKGIDKLKNKVSYVKNQISTACKEGLAMARSSMQSAFNMTFLNSVPVIFWKKTFAKMTDHVQNSVDNMNIDYNDEVITRDDFQDDKALHIKKSAELALHIKSLCGSSVLAYGVTLAVGGIKELIDGSFLNPNGSRSWEDFYADIVGATAVFGEKAFDKKLNKYMDSFLKENRKVNKIENTTKVTADTVVIDEETATIDENNELENNAYASEADESISVDSADGDLAQRKQLLTKEYYNAVQNGDTEAVSRIAEELKNLK